MATTDSTTTTKQKGKAATTRQAALMADLTDMSWAPDPLTAHGQRVQEVIEDASGFLREAGDLLAMMISEEQEPDRASAGRNLLLRDIAFRIGAAEMELARAFAPGGET